jgi:hypothetical protein
MSNVKVQSSKEIQISNVKLSVSISGMVEAHGLRDEGGFDKKALTLNYFDIHLTFEF